MSNTTASPIRKMFAILRVGKIPDWATLRRVSNHNTRTVVSENVQDNRPPPRELLEEGSDDFVASARERMIELGIDPASAKDKIVAVEAVVSASKAWFAQASEQQKAAWRAASLKWARGLFGRGLLTAKEHLDDLKRLAAEFENYKKRTAREQASLSTRATEHLVKELLPIVDDLERALEAAEEHEEVKLEEGVRLVHRQLASALEREGLAEIETDGKFDPHVHEALLSQPSEAEEGSVIEVLQKGYRLGDRVLRPARVVVAGSKEANGDGDS